MTLDAHYGNCFFSSYKANGQEPTAQHARVNNIIVLHEIHKNRKKYIDFGNLSQGQSNKMWYVWGNYIITLQEIIMYVL